jgi:hypothetical protein
MYLWNWISSVLGREEDPYIRDLSDNSVKYLEGFKICVLELIEILLCVSKMRTMVVTGPESECMCSTTSSVP